ncbi:MAG: surface lipoprotein assembly modifier [Moraxellaceae bacterium]
MPPLKQSALVLALALTAPALGLAQTAEPAASPTASPATASATDDAVLSRADQLIAQRQPKSAFDLLAPLEDERSGNPDYDYLYGLAALESGQAGIAAFAFERCLAVDPKNGPCRVQMARTHLALGEDSSAREEIKTIQEYNPPPEVNQMVSRYLGSLEQREAAAKRHFGAYAQIGIGYDSNANSANSTSQIAVAPIGGVVINLVVNPDDRNQSDSFVQGAAGADARIKLSPNWSLLGDIGVSTRGYQEVDRYNYTSGDLSLGAGYQSGASQVQLKALGQTYQLDGEAYRNLFGFMGQYQYQASEVTQYSSYLQATRMSYDEQTFRDGDRYTLGGAWSHALDAQYKPVVYAGLYGGQDKPRTDDPQFVHLGQDFYGVRGGGILFLSNVLQLNGSLSIEHRKYDANYPAPIPTLITRAETQYDAALGLTYSVAPGISIRPTYTYTQTNSNIIINEYNRNVVSIDFRYEL